MEALLVGAAAFAAGVATVRFLGREPPSPEGSAALAQAVMQRLEGIDDRILHSQSAGTDLARGIFEALGDVRRAATTVAEQATEFSALQDLLRAPGARGGLGEAILEELLRQVLPPTAFSMQHRFRSGTIVDAVVRAGDKLVCIDSKFPLSNYRLYCDATDARERSTAGRAFAGDVERHVRVIAERYIVPDEDTLEFAVMYVPAEGLYAEVLRLAHGRRPLFELALEAKVVPMSPLTLYGYLQTVLMGLNCLRIEENAASILGFCGRLQQEMERFASEYQTLGHHLTNARNRHEEGTRKLFRLRDQLGRVVDLDEAEALGRHVDDDLPELSAFP